MKKTLSLIRACMTSDMSLFKIKTKSNSKKSLLIPMFIAFYLMFMIWGGANSLFEKLAPLHIQYILLSVFAFGISIMTFMEGIYKSGPLIFNCKDDQLLLSLPIKKSTILFVRVLKFYIFVLLFNTMFLLPIMIAYIRWAESLSWTYFLTSFIMLLLLPIIPIVLSSIVGAATTSISSRFKYKNIAQIIVSMVFILIVFYISFKLDKITEYLIKHATSLNDLITKIYYPAGVYAKLVSDFNILDLIIFIVVNLCILIIGIFILSKIYFKINSRIKSVVTTKKKNTKLTIKKTNKTISLIKKELNIFFNTPVFIINSGFALVLFIIAVIGIVLKFDSFIEILNSEQIGMNISKDLINNNLSIIIFIIISFTSYMTSITNSVISLEGRNINILKTLPIPTKIVLMSKIYSCMVITTPVLIIGDIILFIKLKISIIEAILLLILSILNPLVSHFIGIIVNLKYPKLDAENATEVVKQSTSSYLSVIIGMVLFIVSFMILSNIIDKISSLIILLISTLIYIIIDLILYIYLTKVGVKEYNKLSV